MTRNIIITLLVTLLNTGCASFSPNQDRLVDISISKSKKLINDPLFEETVAEISKTNIIQWDKANYAINFDSERSPSKATLYIYSLLKKEGISNKEEIDPWVRYYWPFTATRAASTPGTDNVKLNTWKLDRDSYSIANTLIHERVHTFGQIHADGQTTEKNICDAAYVIGDLSEAILLYRDKLTHIQPERNICQGLCDYLIKKDIYSSCNNPAIN